MENFQLDKFAQDGQEPKVLDKILGKILDMLTTGEEVSYVAIQKKPAVNLLPDSITVSNKRIFLCEFTKLGLATNFEIFSWQDIKDIAFKEEIFGSKVTVIPYTGENLTIDYIPKTQARKLYQLIKAALDNLQVQKSVKADTKIVIENKPNFDTYASQQKPVEAPVSNINTPVQENKEADYKTPNTEPTFTSPRIFTQETPISAPLETGNRPIPESVQNNLEEDEITLKLKKLKSLYDKQLITQAEYESKKAEILSKL